MKNVGFGLLTAVLVLSGCTKNSDKKADAPAPKSIDQMTSKEQLAAASYSNEIEKQALSKFIRGTEFCEKFKDVTSKENGFAVQVPVDYQDPSRGTTRIWAYFTSGPFNPNKPTMIYFDGGSGGNSHGSKQALKNFNEIHYDQRGIGCSHPETLALYRDPNFYSNENNARDADEIRKALNIEKVSVYGTSYGTVVATIYASIFKDVTTAAILDGTVFSNDYSSGVTHYYLNKMYKELPDGTKRGMRAYFTNEDQVVSLWMLARMLMYTNIPFDNLTMFLKGTFVSETEINKELADRYFNPNLFQESFFGDEISSVEAFNNQMLNCKGMAHRSIVVMSLFGPMGLIKNEMQKYNYIRDVSQECNAIGVSNPAVPYQAERYPIEVPVTYFQGSQDGATFAEETVRHYKKVAKGPKQLLIAVKGGHCPGIEELRSKNEVAVEIVEQALFGLKIDESQIDSMNMRQSELTWVYTNKNSKLLN